MRADEAAGGEQVRPRHAGEEVVLDLEVEAPITTFMNRPPTMLRDVRTCLDRKSSLLPAGTTAMPLWLGAKLAPM
ncbi:hypothetical protein GCM10025875_19420 [Litorihabitans aurantiacus]|uniref:Uncharacterized protein n=1 Tax=Litorihabitans aurantiacus TaxID=1930061 RepID=A0AA37XF61_9MICO|nr:hypothetical protein GCM10025875_19420 [Litorihabitans aurantiacus]